MSDGGWLSTREVGDLLGIKTLKYVRKVLVRAGASPARISEAGRQQWSLDEVANAITSETMTSEEIRSDLARALAQLRAGGRPSIVRIRRPLSTIEQVKVSARRRANRYHCLGRLVPKPCEKCGAEKVEKHHQDYARPLDVVWLCRPCHMQAHAEECSTRNAASGT